MVNPYINIALIGAFGVGVACLVFPKFLHEKLNMDLEKEKFDKKVEKKYRLFGVGLVVFSVLIYILHLKNLFGRK